MKKVARAIAMALVLYTHPWGHAQMASEYTTVIIKYVGKSDRPFPAIIMSISAEEAEWYRDKLFGDVGPLVTKSTVVQRHELTEIAEVLTSRSAQHRSTPAGRQLPFPRLTIIFGKGHEYTEVWVSSEDGLVLVGEIKGRVSAYPVLAEQLAEFERRMNVKEPH